MTQPAVHTCKLAVKTARKPTRDTDRRWHVYVGRENCACLLMTQPIVDTWPLEGIVPCSTYRYHFHLCYWSVFLRDTFLKEPGSIPDKKCHRRLGRTHALYPKILVLKYRPEKPDYDFLLVSNPFQIIPQTVHRNWLWQIPHFPVQRHQPSYNLTLWLSYQQRLK